MIKSFPKISYAILCYEVSSRDSLTDVDDWLETVKTWEREHDRSVPIALVCTKMDLEGSDKCVVSTREGKEKIEEINNSNDDSGQTCFDSDNPRCRIFEETSAFNDLESINRLFERLSTDIIDRNFIDDRDPVRLQPSVNDQES